MDTSTEQWEACFPSALSRLRSITLELIHLQHVDHVHFHVIPKPSETEGLRLIIGENWPMKKAEPEALAATCEKMKANFI